MITSEIFIYILALVVTSLILLYGYNAINKMRKQTDTVSGIQLQTELTNTIESLGYEFDSVEIKKLNVPNGVEKVCFVWLDEYGGDPIGFSGTNGLDDAQNAVIKDSVEGKSKNNVFMLGGKSFEPFNVGPISVENSFKCFDAVGSRIEVRLQANGKSVSIA